MFVWERGGGAPVCVGCINLEHSSAEMLTKLGGVTINPSLSSLLTVLRCTERNAVGCL